VVGLKRELHNAIALSPVQLCLSNPQQFHMYVYIPRVSSVHYYIYYIEHNSFASIAEADFYFRRKIMYLHTPLAVNLGPAIISCKIIKGRHENWKRKVKLSLCSIN
jgi:hypothetical protein